MGFINKDKIEELSKKGRIILVAGIIGSILIFPGCAYNADTGLSEEEQKQMGTDLLEILLSSSHSREISTGAQFDEMIDFIDPLDKTSLEEGLTQVLDVKDENFKLVLEYKCDLKDNHFWTVTDNKRLNIEVRTDGVVGTKKVYIDNIHICTYLRSCYTHMDGIKQYEDSIGMHGSNMMGIPIDDDIAFSGVSDIVGMNDSFITETTNGLSSLSTEEVIKRKLSETDYLTEGVYANRIVSIIDLIIDDGKNIKVVSVPSEFDILVCPYVRKDISDGSVSYTRYYYDESRAKVLTENVTDIPEKDNHKVYSKKTD